MPAAYRDSIVPGSRHRSGGRDITAFVEAMCVAGTIAAIPPQLLAPERVERRRGGTSGRQGWFEDGIWCEPPERRRPSALERTQRRDAD